MTVTRLPAPLSTSPLADHNPLSVAGAFNSTSQNLPPRSAPPSSIGPLPRPSQPHPARALTSPTTATPGAGMRPQLHQGPSSHSGHSQDPRPSPGLGSQQFKSYSAHGHGNNAQASYFTLGSSGVVSGMVTPATPSGTVRSNGSGRGVYYEEDEIQLNSPNPPFAGGSSASRPSSPRSLHSHSDDTHSNSRYHTNHNATVNNMHANLSQSYGPSSLSASNHSFASSTSNSNSNTYSSPNTSVTSGGSTASTATLTAVCSSCHQPMSGQFVRALGTVFHLDCFRCGDCNSVVASKFFPIEGPDGRQLPLCERDYFRRLNLICAKCEQALRGSYITACNKKFHVEHFTCSVCPTLFGPQDSYYEHNGDVYCHFHYSTRFATKCVGCNSAILKQFVEINRNMRDECWHPECYMIHKFWNVKVASRTPSTPPPDVIPYMHEETEFNAVTLKEKQAKMETLVYRIWTHLSAFEESSAACISEMLRHVSNGMYLDAIRMAEKFILHVEVLFAAIDELEGGFIRAGMSHVREARMLCRKTVDLFTLLSHTQDASTSNPSAVNNQRMGMTQELLSLVTGIAHYLKILIRIALTGALKLEREHGNGDALLRFLDRLQCLALDGADPSARRQQAITAAKLPNVSSSSEHLPAPSSSGAGPSGFVPIDYSRGVAYGYRSLGPECAGESPFSQKAIAQVATKGASSVLAPPSDLCAACRLTVEEDCVRLGTYQRWHSHCVRCVTCGKVSAAPPAKAGDRDAHAAENGTNNSSASASAKPTSKISSTKRPPALVEDFCYDTVSPDGGSQPSGGEKGSSSPRIPIYCTAHATATCRSGFSAVSRLEQYAFLLNVALRRLYLLLHKKGVMQLGAGSTASRQDSNAYRDSADILRMKSSVNLGRKLSATAQLPKRSTIVESPAGKIAQPTQPLATQLHGPDPSVHSQRLGYGGTPNTQQTQQRSQNTQTRSLLPPPRPPPPGISLRPQDESQAPPTQPYTPTPDTHVIRPPFARNNTGVMVVDDRTPDMAAEQQSQHSYVYSEARSVTTAQANDYDMGYDTASFGEDGLTLADIPQLLESEQAREQRRSLPYQAGKPVLAELSPLELQIIKYFAVFALQRSPLKDQFEEDELLEMIEVKKNTFWNKLFNKGSDKKNMKKKGVFGVPLDILAEQGTDSLLGSSRAPLRVPIFIDDVISAMKQMDMSVEGIFRKNGNIRRLKELTDTIDRDPSSVDLTQENPVQLAALLKKFLRDLPDPLMTFKLHKLWNAVVSLPREEDRKRFLHILCVILPKSHRDTMEALFVFLKWVASFSHVDEETGSKMDLQNLATVICPSILYAKAREAAREDSFTAIPVVTELLEGQDEFNTVPDEFLGILQDQDYFSNCLDMPCKDVFKRLDTYLRLKQSGRSPLPGQSASQLQGGGSSSHGFTYGRGDGDGRLAPQRSDPALSRGRSPIVPPTGDGLRSPPPLRMPNSSHSRERKQMVPDNYGGAMGRLPPHVGVPQGMISPGPPSPRQQQKPESPWTMNQPTPRQPPPGNWSGNPGPASRPVSYVRQNGEYFPQTNGRQSPATRF